MKGRAADNRIVVLSLVLHTGAEWTELNPVLPEGVEGYETDTRRRKVGDGVTAWNDLEYDVLEVQTERPHYPQRLNGFTCKF